MFKLILSAMNEHLNVCYENGRMACLKMRKKEKLYFYNFFMKDRKIRRKNAEIKWLTNVIKREQIVQVL